MVLLLTLFRLLYILLMRIVSFRHRFLYYFLKSKCTKFSINFNAHSLVSHDNAPQVLRNGNQNFPRNCLRKRGDIQNGIFISGSIA